MSATTIQLSSEYGYVLLVATSAVFLNTFHVFLTGKHRKLSGIKYPQAYATLEQASKDPKAYVFNCAQRAHANFTENQPSFLAALLIAGLRLPVAAAALGSVWVAARVLYAVGYTSSSGPKGRTTGGITATLIDFGLKGMAAYTAIKMIMGGQ